MAGAIGQLDEMSGGGHRLELQGCDRKRAPAAIQPKSRASSPAIASAISSMACFEAAYAPR